MFAIFALYFSCIFRFFVCIDLWKSGSLHFAFYVFSNYFAHELPRPSRPPSSPWHGSQPANQVSLLESVAFDRDLSDQVRARVLEELAAINARINEARWPGQARASWNAEKGVRELTMFTRFFYQEMTREKYTFLCEAFVASCLCR